MEQTTLIPRPAQGIGAGADLGRSSRVWSLGPVYLVPARRWPLLPWWVLGLVAAYLGLSMLAQGLGSGAATPTTNTTATVGPPCLIHLLTTYPCPTCGAGRGAACLLQGDPLGALSWNPLFFGLLFLVAVLGVLRLVAARRVTLTLVGPLPRGIPWCVGAVLLAGNWTYLVLAGI